MKKIVLLLCIALLSSVTATASDTLLVKVSDFSRKNDKKALLAAFKKASEAEQPVKILLEPKTYCLDETVMDWFHFHFENQKDIVVEGNGATLISTPTNQFFCIRNSRNITFRNFSIDYDPLTFTQGRIKAVDLEHGHFDIQTLEGFPSEILDYHFTKNHGKNGWSHIVVMNDDFSGRNETMKSDHLYIGEAEKIGKKTYRLYPTEKYLDKMEGMKAGNGYVLGIGYLFNRPIENVKETRPENFGSSSCIYIHHSSDILLENVNVYACPGRAMRITDNLGPISIQHCGIRPKPDTDRLIATIIDGIHSKNNKGPVYIQHCHIEGTMDDLINCCQMEELVTKVMAADRIELTNADHRLTRYSLEAGDSLVFMNKHTGKFLGTAKIKSVDQTRERVNAVTLDRPVKGLTGVRDRNDERSITVMNYGRVTSGFVISDNVFIPYQRRAVAVSWCDGVIRNNLVDCRGGGSIWLQNVTKNYEGPFTRNVLVEDNVIRNSVHSSILMGAAWLTGRKIQPEQFDARLVIRNNKIINQKAGKPAIILQHMKNVRLEGNTLDGKPVKAIQKNCSAIFEK